MIDWQSGLKNAMWSMFWLKENTGDEDDESDKEVVKENVARLIRMTTQKNAGQRDVKDCLDWKSLDTTIMTIICAVTSLCLSGYFGEMPKYIEGDETNEAKVYISENSGENAEQESTHNSYLDLQG